jgi:hypothetical protein
LPAGTRFQVSLPTPLAVVLSFFEPDAVAAAWPLYESALLSELGRIAGGIPHDDLAVQWDIAAEICFVLGRPGHGRGTSDGGAHRGDCPGQRGCAGSS